MRSTLALFFSCAVCFGQLPVIPFVTQPKLSSGNSDWIANNGAAQFYWNSLDLEQTHGYQVNSTNKWIDRIQGIPWLQTPGTASPTNTSNTNGVHFNGSQRLDIGSNIVTLKTNATITNIVYAILLNRDTGAARNVTMLTDTNAYYVNFPLNGLLYEPFGPWQEDETAGTPNTYALSTSTRWNPVTTAGHLMDVEVMANYVGSGAGGWHVYTNGIDVGVGVPLLHTNITRMGPTYIGTIAALAISTNVTNPSTWASNVSNTWSNEFKFNR